MECKIKKSVIHTGTSHKPVENGAKVFFHFQTRLKDQDETIVDDSKKMGKPMELVLGKKFKLEVWETILAAMALNEVARFEVDKSMVLSYPFVSKTLRDANKKNGEVRRHCCGSTLQAEGTGYEDLNQMIKDPQDLIFIIELLSIENPGEYERETWQFSDEERLSSVPVLREDGNNLYKNNLFKEASEKYARALGFLDQLMLKEKPRDVEWNELNAMRIPLLLNYAQCMLQTKNYYAVIEHCTTVLEADPTNVKALFRRGRAHIGAWNKEEARADLSQAKKLDPKVTSLVNQQLEALDKMLKEKEKQESERLKGKMF
ncbi:AH receptor-interacting protein [Nilaparvata lugens]|uniref:AH receptor-interacting protein n=1 Tax=Nilaparvata lugens TaxID=108931 RepID=UPI00193EB2CE|nr:AH receptor-interacting protein [Nilaparvata lugens]